MILNVTSVIQRDLIALTQTTAPVFWLCWHQEDQKVPRSTPRCHRKIPRIASFEENSGQRVKLFGSCSYRSRFRNLKKVGGKINVRCVESGCVTRAHCRYFRFSLRPGSTNGTSCLPEIGRLRRRLQILDDTKKYFHVIFL